MKQVSGALLGPGGKIIVIQYTFCTGKMLQKWDRLKLGFLFCSLTVKEVLVQLQQPTLCRMINQSVPFSTHILKKGAGVTRDNVKQLLLLTGAREVHVGSACQEHVPSTVARQGTAVPLGFVHEGACVHVLCNSASWISHAACTYQMHGEFPPPPDVWFTFKTSLTCKWTDRG